jgi:hypothetical protein
MVAVELFGLLQSFCILRIARVINQFEYGRPITRIGSFFDFGFEPAESPSNWVRHFGAIAFSNFAKRSSNSTACSVRAKNMRTTAASSPDVGREQSGSVRPSL